MNERIPMRKAPLLLALAVASLGGCSGARVRPSLNEAANPPGIDTSGAVVRGEVGARVDAFLTRMSGFGYSGNALLVVDGKVVLAKGYGWADRARGLRYTPATLFDIGSMAKTFTGVAVIQLELDGRLKLDDRIGKWLSGVPEDKQAITVEQLLTHTSGIVTDFPYSDPASMYEDVGRDEALRRILSRPLDFAPGTSQAYSNSGYILLAGIVERASGQTFRDYIRTEILEPAKLDHTGFWGDARLKGAPVALGHDEYGEVLHDPMARSPTTWQDLGGGQMLSTVGDLARWVEAIERGRILPPTAVERLWTPRARGLSARDGDYGYGWFIKQTPRGTTVVQHGGDYLGTGAELELYRQDKVLLVTSTNVRTDLYPTRNRTDRVIPRLIFGGDYQAPPAWKEDDAFLRRLLGTYRLPTGGALVVHERGGHYFIGGQGQDAADLLLPASPPQLAQRAEHTARTRRAFEGLRDGDLRELASLSGAGGLGFARAVQQEVQGLGHGKLVKVDVLGTFPSGFPRGHPLDYDTTLVELTFEQGGSPYALRWGNDEIAATDVPHFSLAADAVVEPSPSGDGVSWNIVFEKGIRFTPHLEGERVSSLVIHTDRGDVEGQRLR